jgi:methylated-DNA-protein-cysteine methyltransferase related protein
MSTFKLIYKTVSKIPEGKISTYGNIAKYLGIGNPRVIGYALHANKDPGRIPCHRVVNTKGQLAKGYIFGGPNIQEKLLKDEGVSFIGSKIDLQKSLFRFI